MGNQLDSYGWATADATQAHNYLWPAIRSLLPSRDPAGAKLLDLGCGNGFIAAQLAAMGYNVTGVDASPDGVYLARSTYPGVRFEIGSVYDDDILSSEISSYDVVVSSEVIEHLFFPRKLLALAYRMLAPHGTLILTTPFHGYFKNLALSLLGGWDRHFTADWDGGHIKFFSERTLERLLTEAGFGKPSYANAGRLPFLWKSIVCKVHKR